MERKRSHLFHAKDEPNNFVDISKTKLTSRFNQTEFRKFSKRDGKKKIASIPHEPNVNFVDISKTKLTFTL